jgi:hypothetical protein
LRSAAAQHSYWLDYGSSIQVTATVEMTVDEFFATQHVDSRT